jgi:hypothetical protein
LTLELCGANACNAPMSRQKSRSPSTPYFYLPVAVAVVTVDPLFFSLFPLNIFKKIQK